jgi:ABC-type multidrug transport system permease subunit
MSGNWWNITKLELKLAARDRETVIWSLIAPIIMAWLFGTMFDIDEPGPTTVTIERGDNPAYVETLVAGMFEMKDLVVVESGGAARVVLPDSLIHRVVHGKDAKLQVVKEHISDYRARSVSIKSQQILFTLAFRAKESWLDSPLSDEEVAGFVENEGPILLASNTLGNAPKTVAGVEHQLPAMLVMFLMFQLVTYFMALWVEDIKTGKIKRIIMSPTGMRDIFYAQLASRFMWGLGQVVIILGVGSLILGVRLDIPWHYFAVMLFIYMITAISLGMLLATFFHTTEKATAVGVIAGLVMASLGGCWWPLEVVTDTMRTVALLFPTGLMMTAMEEFIALGQEAAFPRFNFLALAALSAVMMPFAIRRMRRQLLGSEKGAGS